MENHGNFFEFLWELCYICRQSICWGLDFGVFRKINIFWDMKILWIFLGDYHRTGLALGVICMHFRVFSQCQGTEWEYYFGLIKLKM